MDPNDHHSMVNLLDLKLLMNLNNLNISRGVDVLFKAIFNKLKNKMITNNIHYKLLSAI